ncbi:hypothetical protein F0M18_09990 [Pseudohalioglobus sediminis]|uniref:DUF6351 domain-containing protein n=1 Tax=Pseudohalioglobus sediminis TaxID=2606449 RepID=A0A5B0WXR3_9GAMM|nr:DUF6351 family protein [Pseudohalioglobus sediminis]KAA1191852.1 hypothetical protein F0M18_09990 [Pseudohalioglobus sediminis]
MHKNRGSVFSNTLRPFILLFALALITACSDSSDRKPGDDEEVALGEFVLAVLSSSPDQVSGGSARIDIGLPEGLAPENVEISVDGADVTPRFSPNDDGSRLQGVVTDLAEGDNRLAVNSTGGEAPEAELMLTNHPATGPIFSGPQQQPFLCSTDSHRAGLELGPVIDENCSVDTVVSHKYRTTEGGWADYAPGQERPGDMATTTTSNGEEVDFIVRWERGTINRFLYSLAVLAPNDDGSESPDLSAWNRRLVYYFQGGVAIGHYQGSPSQSRALYSDALAAGYAVAYSTGTKTGTHYNLQVGGETAIMVKDRFISAYGAPDYTVGVGGSGGGIQQYVYAQNHPGLIDAGVPQYSYPDMVTQTIHIGDCELIERWIDLQLQEDPNSKWADWNNRSWLLGLNASNDVPNDVTEFGLTPWVPQGSSECTKSWRGLSPLALNPHFGDAPGITPEERDEVEWTHFADLINIYGRADDGFARNPWDNVGVQYGLQALRDGNITAEEFLDLNFNIGSWKPEAEMVQEGCPFFTDLCFALDFDQPLYPDQIDPWSWRNMALSDGSNPAPRRTADPGAIDAAIESGMVNRGDVEIPLIDVRHYLEEQLDMHNTHQSFAARQRLLNHDGDASNQVIWFIAPGEEENYNNTIYAFEVIDEWMTNIRDNPEATVGENRPAAAVDSCFDSEGELIASGEDVWNGILDEEAPGTCTEQFPVYSTSRIVAGAPITGDVFKCELQPVAQAIERGLYGDWMPTEEQVATLEAIFPEGVCDYPE